MSGSEVDAGLEFGVGGDESTCVGELGSSILIESGKSVGLPGFLTVHSGQGMGFQLQLDRRESRMSETSSLMYADTWDLKV